MIDEKFKDKLQLAQTILKDRPDISRTHLARLVHTDSRRISEWEQAGHLKFQPQIGGWKRYKWSIKRKLP